MEAHTALERGPRSVHVEDDRRNVGVPERWVSIIAGGALVALGLARRSPLGAAAAAAGGLLLHRGATGHCRLYGALGIDTTERPEHVSVRHGIRVEHAVTIDRPRAELYRFWRQFENLPRFMRHLERVTMLEDGRSHWVARAPAGMTAEWDAVLINEVPDEMIAWRSLAGSEIDHAGSVHFEDAPAGRGAVVRVVMQFAVPGGRLGQGIARVMGEEPDQQIRDDLDRLKRTMEAGQVPAVGDPSRG